MKLLIILIFSIATCIADDISVFDEYLKLVEEGKVSRQNAVEYIRKVEVDLFKNISVLFDKLQYSDLETNYIVPKEKVQEFATIWNKDIKSNNLVKKLKKLSKNPKTVLENSKLKKMLKRNRKYGQILRESFYIFDRDHKAPKKLQNVVKPFGKLNDAVVSQNPVLVEKYSKKVIKGLRKLDKDKILDEFQYINKAEFTEFFKHVKDDVTTTLEKQTHSIHDFHWVRKQHKKFLVIYYNLERYTPHNKVALLDNYITKLGDLNDIYVDLKMRFKLDLKAYDLVIPSKIKSNMAKTIEYLEKDMSSVALAPRCQSYFLLK